MEFVLFEIDCGLTGGNNGVAQSDLGSGFSNPQVWQTPPGEMVMASEGQNITLAISIEGLMQVQTSLAGS
ncbi:MAG: hypothetical protein A2Z37_05850 [Chloroflexi bacterium RBG_19FT_COMBO_62_14]|nr:MAG: hypothetical protein A2Z37_05850 [Chloroflexi bacterium RBG_19FT_COMBO_62_14]